MRGLISIIFLMLMIGACSSDRARRTTYETLENIRMQRCAGDFTADCDRGSYNDYTRKREEVVK